MSKFKVVFVNNDGTTEDADEEVFDTYEEAEEHECYLSSCAHLGAETLHLSNPGDYPDSDIDYDFDIEECDD